MRGILIAVDESNLVEKGSFMGQEVKVQMDDDVNTRSSALGGC